MSERAIRKIVVGLDGSDDSTRALDWAIRMALGMDGEVIAVHAIDLPPHFAAPVGLSLERDPEWHAEMMAVFDHVWCRPLRQAGLRYAAVLETGHPATVLARVAEDRRADIVVVGRHGLGWSGRQASGSVSRELSGTCAIPVLVIPRPVALESLPIAAAAES